MAYIPIKLKPILIMLINIKKITKIFKITSFELKLVINELETMKPIIATLTILNRKNCIIARDTSSISLRQV